jgi:3-methyladenine DNA glycosylase AlkD
MTLKEALALLEAAGSAQTRKTYARHGVGPKMFGVSYAVLGKLTRQIKRDHALALALWDSGWHDARVLALMIADPLKADVALVNTWAVEGANRALACAVAKFAAATPHAETLAAQWCAATDEFIAATGWDLVAELAVNAELPDAKFAALNLVRYAMNNALIAIGCRNAKLERLAVAAAKRIGKVEVDHGDTSCQTPDAVAYIAKTWARRAKRNK